MTVAATLDTSDPGSGLTVVLRLTNTSATSVGVLDPAFANPPPDGPWTVETYRVAQLLSYGFLRITVTDREGERVEPSPVETWATHVLRAPLVLAPGEHLDVPIPLGAFYELSPGASYRLAIAYGEGEPRVTAEADVVVPASGG
ncbi:hypothetical protein AB0I28_08955 [Phytomonospora sp. NPDC050363]|uniref:hypothetical protein n=1 Tax=Phytomonospora sp. NPDC050363 TaxID=3155642 RepID=UPI0034019A67